LFVYNRIPPGVVGSFAVRRYAINHRRRRPPGNGCEVEMDRRPASHLPVDVVHGKGRPSCACLHLIPNSQAASPVAVGVGELWYLL